MGNDASATALASFATGGDPFISAAFLGGIEALNAQQRGIGGIDELTASDGH